MRIVSHKFWNCSPFLRSICSIWTLLWPVLVLELLNQAGFHSGGVGGGVGPAPHHDPPAVARQLCQGHVHRLQLLIDRLLVKGFFALIWTIHGTFPACLEDFLHFWKPLHYRNSSFLNYKQTKKKFLQPKKNWRTKTAFTVQDITQVLLPNISSKKCFEIWQITKIWTEYF